MAPDFRYSRDERAVLRLAIFLGVIVLAVALLLAALFRPRESKVPDGVACKLIQTVASSQGINPEFVYAIAWAESSLNPRARSSVARGMMQLTEAAWKQVSQKPYRAAWDWQTNVEVAVDYLTYCRSYLEQHGAFSYPLLAACYRFGPHYVKRKQFDLKNIDRPQNEIYRAIFDGDLRPVPLPKL